MPTVDMPAAGPDQLDGPARDRPVSAAEAAFLFAGLADAEAVLLAVSGGPDSLAMLHLASQWRRQGIDLKQRRPELHVAVVDHGLRPEAAAEAAMVTQCALNLGLAGTVLTWRGDKPATGLQAAARAARYGLLFDHAHAVGASHVVTAHHADDLAETILMRLCAGSGIAGLAGMKALSPRGPLWLARPLLSLDKSRLMATCEAAGINWVQDPGNLDVRKGRGKLRGLAGQLAALGLERDRLLRLGKRAARADAALEHAVDVALTDAHAHVDVSGFSVDLRCLAIAPEEITIRAIGRLLMRSNASLRPDGHGQGHRRLERLERAVERLTGAVHDQRVSTVTLGGMLLRLDRQGICRGSVEKPRRSSLRHQGISTPSPVGE